MRSPSFLSPLQYGRTLFVLAVMLLVFFLSDPARFLGWLEEQTHASPPAAALVKDVETAVEARGLLRTADAQKRLIQALQLHETGGRIRPRGAGEAAKAEGMAETTAGRDADPVVPWEKVMAYFTGLPERLRGALPLAHNATTVQHALAGNATLPGLNGTVPQGNGTMALSGVNGTVPASNGTAPVGNATLGAVNATLPQGDAVVVVPVASPVPLEEGVKGKILLTGDSMMMEGLGPVLLRFLRGHAGVEVVREAVYSTGLCRADYFDWPAHMKTVVEQHKPHLVIICLGANDGQDIVDDTKKRHIAGTDSWKVQYRERAKLLLAAAQSTGARVIWMGLPIMGKEPHSTYIKALAAEQQAACEEASSCLYIDTWTTLAGTKGEFLSFIQGENKVHTRIRANDKVHVTEAGGKLLLAEVSPTLEVMFPRPPAVNATAATPLSSGNGTASAAKSAGNGTLSPATGTPGAPALQGTSGAAVAPATQPGAIQAGAGEKPAKAAPTAKKPIPAKAGKTAKKRGTAPATGNKAPSPVKPIATNR